MSFVTFNFYVPPFARQRTAVENQESYGVVYRQCQMQNFRDFNKVFNHRILKMVNDLYLL